MTASIVFDFRTYRMKEGIATAARMPMMATTIMSSMSVKPRARESFLIEIMYSHLPSPGKPSVHDDDRLAGCVADAHTHASLPVGEREDLNALLPLAFEEASGEA